VSDKRFAVVVMTSGLAEAGLDQDGVVEATSGTVVDATEASLTLSMPDRDAMKAAIEALTGRGLTLEEDVFEVEVDVPDWLDQYKEAASAMLEHGG